MAQFILANVFMVSAGALLFLMVRALPRIEEEKLPPLHKTAFERLVMSGIPEKLDAVIDTYSGKAFRKLKVFLMRFDNYLTGRIQRSNGNGHPSATLGGNGNGNPSTLLGAGGNGKPKVDFVKEIIAEKNGNGNGTH